MITSGQWVDIIPAAPNTFGNAPRTIGVRSPSTRLFDLSVIKNTRIVEGFNAQFVSLAELSGGAYPGRQHAAAALEVALGFDQLEELDVVVRDLERGLIDFPSLIDGEEVYLCWLLDEPEVVYWHAPESGFGGRRPL